MRLIKIVGLSLSVLAASAMAQDEAKSAWSGESELGYARKSGNTNDETLNFRQKVVYDAKPFVNTFLFTARNTTTEITTTDASGNKVKEEKRTAEAYFASNKSEYFFSDRNYAFGLLTAERNRFNGYQRQFTEVLGAGRQFIKSDAINLKAELGVGYSQSKFDVRDADNKFWQEQAFAYFGEEFTWKASEAVEVGQTLKIEAGDETTTSRFMAYVKAQLQKSLAFKLSYEVKYIDEAPGDKEKRDDLLLASLLYSF